MSDEYWLTAVQHPAENVAIVWNGNQHNAHFLLEFDQPLRLAGVEGLRPTVGQATRNVIVSRSIFEELWRPDFDELKRVIQLIRSNKRCFVIGTPPPKDSDEILSHLKSDEYFVHRALSMGVSVEDFKVTPNDMRVALWEQIQNGMRSVARETDSVFVEVPDSCLTSSKLLPIGLGVPDATHANGSYGARILDAISQKWRGMR